MSPWHPRAENLPAEFAVFPLPGALLLPHGRLPLNIFEPRYLAMTEDALAAGRMFAMIQPDTAKPPGPSGPALYRVGCLGRLTSFSETDDGRFLIQLIGVTRFTVITELGVRRGYRRVQGDFSSWLGDLEPLSAPKYDRESLLSLLGVYFARTSIEVNWEPIRRLSDAALPLTLAMLCPFDPVEKQALLEAPDQADRVATLRALLQMGSTNPSVGHRLI